LLKVIAGLQPVNSGSVQVGQDELTGMDELSLHAVRKDSYCHHRDWRDRT
jgi:predicted ABC-type transport system involved in lysophospholipase L1 biosynthesis ATPase subunit